MSGYEDRASILQGAGDMIFNLVCDRSTPQQWAEWLRVPLEHAAGTANHDLVDKLLKAGANGSAGWRGCDDHTLLHAGAQGGNPQVVSALITAGAGADMKARTGGKALMPLHLAALGGKAAATNALLLAGADVNAHSCCNNNTPLYLAIKHGHLKVAESLLSYGADASIKSPKGAYPIHLVAGGGYDEIVIALLRNGATWNCLDAAGKTPLRLAAYQGHASTVKVILTGGGNEGNHPATRSSKLHMAAYSDDADAIPALVDGGADVEARSYQDLTPLFSAAYLGSGSALLALLQLGADVNITTTIDGSTPLHAACCRGDYRMADALLKSGADATATDNRGETPGKWIPPTSNGPTKEKRREIHRVSELLAAACRERAWRRRGYLVMCRAYPSRRQILLETSTRTSDAYWQPPPRSSRRVGSEEAGIRTEVEVADKGQGGGGGGGGGGGTKIGDGFGNVMAWLMGLKNEGEGPFRSIVGFL